MDVSPLHFMKSYEYRISWLSTHDIETNNDDIEEINNEWIADNSFIHQVSTHYRDKFTDFTIKLSDNVSIHVHKLVISVYSKYFSTLLLSSMHESQCNEVNLSVFDTDAVQSIVNYMYTGILYIGSRNIINTIEIAHYLQVEYVVNECVIYLANCINSTTWQILLHLAKLLSSNILLDDIYHYIARNFIILHDLQLLFSLELEDIVAITAIRTCAIVDSRSYYNDRLRRSVICIDVLLSYITHHKLYMPSDVLTLIRDKISYVPPHERHILLTLYDNYTAALTSVCNAIPYYISTKLKCELESVYVSEARSITICDNISYYVDTIQSYNNPHRECSDLGYITGMHLYFDTIDSDNHVICRLDIFYRNLLLPKSIGRNIPSACKYVFTLPDGERIADIKISCSDAGIHLISFISNNNNTVYGPYGIPPTVDTEYVTDYDTLIPSNIRQYGHIYLLDLSCSAILYYVQSRIVNLRFTWIHSTKLS